MVDKNGLVTPGIWQKMIQTLPFNVKVPTAIEDTHANRANFAAGNYPDGSLFQETDRGLIYVALESNWFYLSGILQSVQSGLPFDFSTDDVGLPAYIQDFNHLLMWSGQKWQWYPGEVGSDFIVPFVSGPNPAVGWQACDGSNVLKLNSDGTTTQVTLPVTPGSFYRR